MKMLRFYCWRSKQVKSKLQKISAPNINIFWIPFCNFYSNCISTKVLKTYRLSKKNLPNLWILKRIFVWHIQDIKFVLYSLKKIEIINFCKNIVKQYSTRSTLFISFYIMLLTPKLGISFFYCCLSCPL